MKESNPILKNEGIKYGLQLKKKSFNGKEAPQSFTKHTIDNTTIINPTDKAIDIDSNIYEYDSIYDDMKARQQSQRNINIDNRNKMSSKYAQNIKKAAEIRKIEHDILYEKKCQKEQLKEGNFSGEKFITSAYKKELEKRSKRLKELAEEAEIEKQNSATKKGDIFISFYNNLLDTISDTNTNSGNTNSNNETISTRSSIVDSIDNNSNISKVLEKITNSTLSSLYNSSSGVISSENNINTSFDNKFKKSNLEDSSKKIEEAKKRYLSRKKQKTTN